MSATTPGRRRAAPAPTPTTELQEGIRLGRWGRTHFSAILTTLVVVVAGLLALSVAGIGPAWWGMVGAVTIAVAYSVMLSSRIGGRPVVFGALALALGVAAAWLDNQWWRAGAAVMITAITAGLAVMGTIPSRTVRGAIREVLFALLVSVVGGLAVLGVEPVLVLPRFRVVASVIAFVLVFALVYRLGEGWHGLGRRGLVAVAGGFVGLALTLTYAVVLQRYGSPDLVVTLTDWVAQRKEQFGALPRPVQAFIGIPGIIWGSHMRARRGQGWWVSAFGVSVTVSLIYLMVRSQTWLEFALSEVYSLLIGIVVSVVLITLDLRLSGNRGRRARREEAAAAVRPEPARTRSLFVG